MNFILNPIVLVITIGLLFYCYLRKITQTPKLLRGDFIRDYEFPQWLQQKMVKTSPHLDQPQADEIIKGLRAYFQICNMAQGDHNSMAMPSQAVDRAWQVFILDSERYGAFCEQAFGQFLHHTPAQGGLTPAQAQLAIKTTFKYACKLFNISRKTPAKLPPLFALDAQLNLADGSIYALNHLDNNGKPRSRDEDFMPVKWSRGSRQDHSVGSFHDTPL